MAAPGRSPEATAVALPERAMNILSSLLSAAVLGWAAWQLIRMWWLPLPTDGAGPGLAAWVSGFFMCFAPLFVAAHCAAGDLGGVRHSDDLILRGTVVFLGVAWCLGAGSIAVYATSSGDGPLVRNYLFTIVPRIASLYSSVASTRGPRHDAIGGVMRRWGMEVGLFLAFTFAALWLPVPEGNVGRTATGRGIFEQDPEKPLAAMAGFYLSLAAIELSTLRQGLRSGR